MSLNDQYIQCWRCLNHPRLADTNARLLEQLHGRQTAHAQGHRQAGHCNIVLRARRKLADSECALPTGIKHNAGSKCKRQCCCCGLLREWRAADAAIAVLMTVLCSAAVGSGKRGAAERCFDEQWSCSRTRPVADTHRDVERRVHRHTRRHSREADTERCKGSA